VHWSEGLSTPARKPAAVAAETKIHHSNQVCDKITDQKSKELWWKAWGDGQDRHLRRQGDDYID